MSGVSLIGANLSFFFVAFSVVRVVRGFKRLEPRTTRTTLNTTNSIQPSHEQVSVQSNLLPRGALKILNLAPMGGEPLARLGLTKQAEATPPG